MVIPASVDLVECLFLNYLAPTPAYRPPSLTYWGHKSHWNPLKMKFKPIEGMWCQTHPNNPLIFIDKNPRNKFSSKGKNPPRGERLSERE